MPAPYGTPGPLVRSNSVSIEWAGLGPELLLRLRRDGTEPLRAQLEREIRDAIRSGRLAPRERLPSSRELARELGLARGTVLECYAQLRAEGYLTARAGAATYVSTSAQAAPAPPAAPAPARRLEIDFLPGRPDLSSFPRHDWLWALRAGMRTATRETYGYGDPRGNQQLRVVLAAYLRRVRGAVADPERLVICSGITQALTLLFRIFAAEGAQAVAFEDPGHPDQLAAARRAALVAVPVPVDAHGIQSAALPTTSLRAVLVSPAHQSPSGVVLAPERRQTLIEWAAASAATIIENDYDAEFRYDREPIGALQGLAPNHVALLGTVSKSLAPALRLGWILAPPDLTQRLVDEKAADDRGSAAFDQLALALLIESGRYDKHLRQMRSLYSRRRQALIDALAKHAPDVKLSGLAAGIHAVAHLPDTLDEETVIERARERSIGLRGMSHYRADGSTRPAQIVLGFGDLTAEAITHGIAKIANLFRS
jgi:GntR family transcriptional regulator/MocR family aminotransferase